MLWTLSSITTAMLRTIHTISANVERLTRRRVGSEDDLVRARPPAREMPIGVVVHGPVVTRIGLEIAAAEGRIYVARSIATASALSSIRGVNRPVNVFC